MIHRQNYLDTRTFLQYITEVRQNCPETIARTRTHLRHLLEWADALPLTRAHGISPTLPVYLAGLHLSSSSITKGLEACRHFFTFARERWPLRYRKIGTFWIGMLLPPRGARLHSHLQDHQYYTLEHVRRLAAVSAETLRLQRAQVAACMLFLSGMRVDALATLPNSCVELARREIHQLPEKGVRTKNRKAAITYLLEIPDLLAVVETWDRAVRDLGPESLWYSPLTTDGMRLAPSPVPHLGRGDLLSRDLRLLCTHAAVPYLSPHKLRHGHVVHALKNARNLADLKAISQNVMHASVTITDQVYGRLVTEDVRALIGNLGTKAERGGRVEIDRVIALLESLKHSQVI